jgi:hypothetical protein
LPPTAHAVANTETPTFGVTMSSNDFILYPT